ncbi:hypothetical protein GCM10018793_13060 [Streptomyces sulfonofaciens]|uniref:Uncharacterized protein n=1 Tax=Streptomyces sulfonofaciens TaxID=68272 RepID=A0A919FXL2_9ACTN|nr:hypothetical protein [Streptomyces sulfonofaciens]GHH73759.1 hypothetical protein GCM10018793_13060 [Streptomyces sulfonofaciens]
MDTAKLELAVQRQRDAQVALEAAGADVRAEIAVLLESAGEREVQAQVEQITGWTPRQLRQLMKAARRQAKARRG